MGVERRNECVSSRSPLPVSGRFSPSLPICNRFSALLEESEEREAGSSEKESLRSRSAVGQGSNEIEEAKNQNSSENNTAERTKEKERILFSLGEGGQKQK